VRVALALVVVLLAGCGGGGSPDEAVVAKTDLKVTVWPNGLGGDETFWQLRCDPVGGDHPDAETACATLAALKDPFAKLKPTPRCEEIPGASPEVARLEGTYRGEKVDETFDRSSGCVFERWDRVAPVFPTGF